MDRRWLSLISDVAVFFCLCVSAYHVYHHNTIESLWWMSSAILNQLFGQDYRGK